MDCLDDEKEDKFEKYLLNLSASMAKFQQSYRGRPIDEMIERIGQESRGKEKSVFPVMVNAGYYY